MKRWWWRWRLRVNRRKLLRKLRLARQALAIEEDLQKARAATHAYDVHEMASFTRALLRLRFAAREYEIRLEHAGSAPELPEAKLHHREGVRR